MKIEITPQKKLKLAQIAFRCAMYVSVADDAGGQSSDIAEERVLKRRLQSLYRSSRSGALDREIYGIILSNTQKWRGWREGLSELLMEIEQNFDFMSPDLRKSIFSLSIDVAIAFEERSVIGSMIYRIISSLRNIFSASEYNLSPQEKASISRAEAAALNELAAALKLPSINF